MPGTTLRQYSPILLHRVQGEVASGETGGKSGKESSSGRFREAFIPVGAPPPGATAFTVIPSWTKLQSETARESIQSRFADTITENTNV